MAREPERAEPQDSRPSDAPAPDEAPPEEAPALRAGQDPIGWLAEAAGYSDGERWWEQMVEHRRDGTNLFQGINEAMAALREAAPLPEGTDARIEALREATMRQGIRAAERERFARIAVVCGAWHAPALSYLPPESDDASLLTGPSAVKVAATWVPWTHGRLSLA